MGGVGGFAQIFVSKILTTLENTTPQLALLAPIVDPQDKELYNKVWIPKRELGNYTAEQLSKLQVVLAQLSLNVAQASKAKQAKMQQDILEAQNRLARVDEFVDEPF